MKAHPSVLSPALPLWKLYIFPLIMTPAVSLCGPTTAPLILAAHGQPADVAPSLLFSQSFFSFAFVAQNQLGGRGEGREGEAMESWMVLGRRDSFHVCSSGVMGVGSRTGGIGVDRALQSDPL